jgi:tRNA pseudouridine38-40 synthase
MTQQTVERLKLLIAYDGRAFRGWQSQASNDSVQDHLERAAARVCGVERVVVHGSGRTDTGVHALGQTAHIEVPRGRHAPRVWLAALNANLPPEVRILWNDPVFHPLEIGRAWHVPTALDPSLLQAATKALTGTHDFAGFAANRGYVERDTVRTIHEIRISRRGPVVTLRFTGNGFLYRMVRLLTGSIVRVAQGKAPVAWLEGLLAQKEPTKSSFAAPADGLYLVRVIY